MCLNQLLSVALTGLSLTAFPESAALPPLRPHPRLFANEQTFADLKTHLASDEMVRLGSEHVKSLAEKYLADPLPKHGITDGRRMLSTSHYVEEHVLNLAMAYRLFGDRLAVGVALGRGGRRVRPTFFLGAGRTVCGVQGGAGDGAARARRTTR